MRRKLNCSSKAEFNELIKGMKEVQPGVWVGKDGTVVVLKYVDTRGYDDRYFWFYPSKSINNAGYVQLGINGKVVLLHRLVAEAYLENPQNLRDVDHINGRKDENNVENLRYCSHSDNMKSAWKNGQIGKGCGINKYGKYYFSTGILTMPNGKKIKMSKAEYIDYRIKNGLRVTKNMLKEV